MRLDNGPLGRRYAATLAPGLNERALECFGSDELSFPAFVASPEGLGGTVAYVITPAWLDTWNASGLYYLASSDREAAPGSPNGPFFQVAVPPESRSAFDARRGMWATITGRFDAPAANSCVATPPKGADVPLPADIVGLCRTSFAISAVRPASDPCPGTADLQALIATPERLRADCFGGRPISFDSLGWPINNAWPGVKLPPDLSGDWVLAPDGKTDGLWVFVPPSVNGSGTYEIAPYVARWKVEGHVDDAMADDCTPSEGDTIDGVPVVKSLGEVRAFCRNHFVVDRLTRLPAATASPVGE